MRSYRDWSVTTKVLAPLGGALLLIAVGLAALIYPQRVDQVRQQAERMAAALAIQIAEDRTYSTKNVVGTLQADGLPVVAHDSRFRDEKGGIPLPATFVKELTAEINKRGHYRADLISPWPINKDHVTQQNAAQTDELSATAQTLAVQARSLQTLVGGFRLSEQPAAPVTGRAIATTTAIGSERNGHSVAGPVLVGAGER